MSLLHSGNAAAMSICAILAAVTAPSLAQDYPIAAVPLTAVRLTDRFWAPRLETNRTVTIPHILRQNELTGRIDNFLKAARRKTGAYQGQRYNDSDVYKIIEAASWSLMATRDSTLEAVRFHAESAEGAVTERHAKTLKQAEPTDKAAEYTGLPTARTIDEAAAHATFAVAFSADSAP